MWMRMWLWLMFPNQLWMDIDVDFAASTCQISLLAPTVTRFEMKGLATPASHAKGELLVCSADAIKH